MIFRSVSWLGAKVETLRRPICQVLPGSIKAIDLSPKAIGLVMPNAVLQRERHLLAADGCAYHFFAAISFTTSISRSRSARSFFSLAFSCSNWRSFFTSSAFMPLERWRQVYIVCSLMPCRLAACAPDRGPLRSGCPPNALQNIVFSAWLPLCRREPPSQISDDPKRPGRSSLLLQTCFFTCSPLPTGIRSQVSTGQKEAGRSTHFERCSRREFQ